MRSVRTAYGRIRAFRAVATPSPMPHPAWPCRCQAGASVRTVGCGGVSATRSRRNAEGRMWICRPATAVPMRDASWSAPHLTARLRTNRPRRDCGGPPPAHDRLMRARKDLRKGAASRLHPGMKQRECSPKLQRFVKTLRLHQDSYLSAAVSEERLMSVPRDAGVDWAIVRVKCTSEEANWKGRLKARYLHPSSRAQ